MWSFPRVTVRTRRRTRRPKARSARATAHFREHKVRARELVHARLAYWNEHYQCTYGRVAIRNTRSRWGSCSSKQNLNFSYKIIFLPEPLIDYIIVHELCHLLSFDHSPTFWGHVARALPDHNERRTALKKYSLLLWSETLAQTT